MISSPLLYYYKSAFRLTTLINLFLITITIYYQVVILLFILLSILIHNLAQVFIKDEIFCAYYLQLCLLSIINRTFPVYKYLYLLQSFKSDIDLTICIYVSKTCFLLFLYYMIRKYYLYKS